jgi:acyl transferase domain-containing protein
MWFSLKCIGTGTALGDPIEVKSLSSVYYPVAGDVSSPLIITAVKSNIGHCEVWVY